MGALVISRRKALRHGLWRVPLKTWLGQNGNRLPTRRLLPLKRLPNRFRSLRPTFPYDGRTALPCTGVADDLADRTAAAQGACQGLLVWASRVAVAVTLEAGVQPRRSPHHGRRPGRDLQLDTHQLSELLIAMQETITAEGVDLIEHGDSCQMMLCAFPNSRQSS
jgi:hypothetical protein